ncbi:MAG: carboxymuconolactone decarboxylase family protein [Sphaerochaetaceae bacterium]
MGKYRDIPVRINYSEVSPEAAAVLINLEKYIYSTGLEHSLLELVKMRSSQINGCAYCIDMHTKDARSRGETEQRLYALNAWREAPFYTDRERAALEWTEAVTKISEHKTTDAVYEIARSQFSEKELVDLTFAIVSINSWNRLAISFHSLAGSYKPEHPVAGGK